MERQLKCLQLRNCAKSNWFKWWKYAKPWSSPMDRAAKKEKNWESGAGEWERILLDCPHPQIFQRVLPELSLPSSLSAWKMQQRSTLLLFRHLQKCSCLCPLILSSSLWHPSAKTPALRFPFACIKRNSVYPEDYHRATSGWGLSVELCPFNFFFLFGILRERLINWEFERELSPASSLQMGKLRPADMSQIWQLMVTGVVSSFTEDCGYCSCPSLAVLLWVNHFLRVLWEH